MSVESRKEGQVDEIDLRELFSEIWSAKIQIIIVAAVFAIATFTISRFITPTYSASVLVVLADAENSGNRLQGVVSQLGGIAALAGLSGTANSRRAEFVATLQSDVLASKYVQDNQLLPLLFYKKWDSKRSQWQEDSEKPPTLWQATRRLKKIRNVDDDTKTGLIRITIRWHDPKLATEWANGLVALTNEYLRQKAIAESQRNIAYLEDQAGKTTRVQVQSALYGVMESEVKTLMLASGRIEYALRIVDPAVVPEKPSYPLPFLWSALGLFFGAFVTVVVVVGKRLLKD